MMPCVSVPDREQACAYARALPMGKLLSGAKSFAKSMRSRDAGSGLGHDGSVEITSFDVLYLLAQLLDCRLQFQPRRGQRNRGRLAAQRVGLAIELLHQEVETPADIPRLVQQRMSRLDMAGEPIELFAYIGAGGEQGDLLSDAFLGQ